MTQPNLTSTGTSQTLPVALVQMTATKSVETNLAFLETHICKAAALGARYVQTPENSLLMDLDGERVARVVESDLYRHGLERLFALAKELNIWLHIGGTPVLVDQTISQESTDQSAVPQLANRSFVIGQMRDFYDKIHMFDVQLQGGEHYRESQNYKAGKRAVVVETDFARLGLSICYDLRFAGLYRQLAQAGAEMIAVPAAFTAYTGQAHWHVLLRARAIETGCFVVACAQTGTHETGRDTFGHSLVVAPWGDVVLDAGAEAGVFTAQLDLQQIRDARGQVPSLRHDRPFEVDAPL